MKNEPDQCKKELCGNHSHFIFVDDSLGNNKPWLEIDFRANLEDELRKGFEPYYYTNYSETRKIKSDSECN